MSAKRALPALCGIVVVGMTLALAGMWQEMKSDGTSAALLLIGLLVIYGTVGLPMRRPARRRTMAIRPHRAARTSRHPVWRSARNGPTARSFYMFRRRIGAQRYTGHPVG